jgi:hypothetical protein
MSADLSSCFETRSLPHTRSLLPSQLYLLCRSSHSLRCYGARSGRSSTLWDITKAETTLGNVPNAGRRMSGSRARRRSNQRNNRSDLSLLLRILLCQNAVRESGSRQPRQNNSDHDTTDSIAGLFSICCRVKFTSRQSAS